ncbi:MAG: hypothetical protein VKJ46_07310, partial [Leptolyngbyaceae bacterium]|nr:hypothetical protein [Leptolyngbyaceae bacterium]
NFRAFGHWFFDRGLSPHEFTPMLGVHTALVRTEQRLLVGVQGYLPPHNFTVSWLRFWVGVV